MIPVMKARTPLTIALLAAVLAAGCGLAGGNPTPAPPATGTAGPTPVVPTPTALAVPTETPAPQPGPLPAPVVYLSSADGQIWRLERDGRTAAQVTHQAAPVTYFDVSPSDGTLVYVSDNTLFLAGADGGDPQSVFSGPRDIPDEGRLHSEIVFPRWSPDGRRIAFGYAGIQILDLDQPMLAPNVLVPSDPYPDMNAGRPPTMPRFFRQALWSPDGSRLLIEYLNYPEGNGWVVLLLNSDAGLLEMQSPPEGGILCCDPTWSADGQFIYFASPYVGLGTPGLRRSVAATGQTETLIAPAGEPGNETYFMVDTARQLADGKLYYFLGTVQGFPDGSFTPLTMYRAEGDAGDGSALRADSHTLEEVLWARDGSGAVIMRIEQGAFWPFHGPLVWLPADGSAAVPLPADGSTLAWGG